MIRSLTNSIAIRRRNRTARRPQAETLEGRLLLTAGGLDNTFGTGGSVLLSSPSTKKNSPSIDIAYAAEVQPDSKILVAGVGGSGSSPNKFQVVRLKPDGTTPDSSFGSGGRVMPLDGYAMDMALQQDGGIVLAGRVQVTTGSGRNTVTQYDVAVVRLTRDGKLDSSFDGDGVVTTPISTSSGGSDPFYDDAQSIAVQPDGKIVVGGRTYSGSMRGYDSVLVRYNTNGSLDDGSASDTTPGDSFGQGGIIVTPWSPTYNDSIMDLGIQGDGKIVVAGKGYLDDASHGYPYFVARYNADGSLDDGSASDTTPGDSFGTDRSGAAITPFGYSNAGWGGSDHPLVLQPNGAIVFALDYYRNGVDIDIALARFTPAGVLDGAFGNGTGFVTLARPGRQYARSVAIQADGKLIVAGSEEVSGGAFVARFQRDGTLDGGFGDRPGDQGLVIRPFGSSGSRFYDVAIQADGKIVAAGQANGDGIDFLVARYLGDSGSSPAVASLSAPGSPTAISPLDEVMLAPLAPSTDLDLTQLATEWLRPTPKRSRPALRAPSRQGTL
jgi:uncharacterized delta-60 repeat protein